MVKIEYFGHSCFEVSGANGSIVFDPYSDGSVPGLKLPNDMTADAVYCSHGHGDHNAEHLVEKSGHGDPYHVEKITVPHDDAEGSKRGLTKITFVDVDDITVAHLGDIGRLPLDQEYKELAKADVVMIPCGGFYTIDSSQAQEIIDHLKKPALKILMHFRDGAIGYDVLESIGDVMQTISDAEYLEESEIVLDPKAVPNRIITLKPLQ